MKVVVVVTGGRYDAMLQRTVRVAQKIFGELESAPLAGSPFEY